jgi:uncharacterized repeat protein (TIGR01451 family)
MRFLHRLSLLSIIGSIILVAALVAGLGVAGAEPDDPEGAIRPGDLTFQTVTISAGEDTTLHAWWPTTNYASDTVLAIRSGNVAAPIIRFDLSSLTNPEDLLVAQARLRFYVESRTNTQPIGASAYAVNKEWVANQATWQDAKTNDPWGTAGCNAVPGDRSGVASDEVMISAVDTWVSLDVTEIVRGWLSGESPNYGFLLKGTSGGSVAYNLYSLDYSAVWRPKLEIMLAPMPTPEPTGTPMPTATPSPTPMAPALWLLKEGPVGPLAPGQFSVQYTITLRSVGTQSAAGVVLTDALPLGTVFLNASHGGVYHPDQHEIVWNVGSMAIGEELIIQVEAGLATWVKDTGNVVNVVRASGENCAPAESYWEIVVVPPSATPTPTASPTPSPTPTPVMFKIQLGQVFKFFVVR